MRRASALLLLLAGPVAARHPPPPPLPTGELVLDLDAPFVDATLAGVTLRLKVTLDARDAVELNPGAAARLPLAFEEAGMVEVGRVTLRGRQARAEGMIAGRPVALVVETHGARCCVDSDGEVGPEQLPFARVRFLRAGAGTDAPASFPAEVTASAGFSVPVRVGGGSLLVKLAPDAPATVATAAAGAILARAGGGRWDGPARTLPLAFGVVRPVRPLRLARPVSLLGRPVDAMLVRTADFRGGRALPEDPAARGDILVRGRARASQHDWPAITLGRPELDGCTEIVAERVPAPMLRLRCGPPAP